MDTSASTPPAGTALAITPQDGIEIVGLHTAEHMQGVVDVFQQVWGSPTELIRLELLMAITHSGGYVAAAVDGQGKVLGASVALLAVHDGAPALHSHITGILPGVRQTGLGRRVKLHQQSWARERGIEWIVWTFDPLVRRNAWFNIAVLGVEVHDYLDSFYGAMTDAINAGDESDRLLVAWDLATDPDHALFDGDDVDEPLLIPTPDDVVALRRTDPAAVATWRSESRASWHAALAEQRRVLGFTRGGDYVLGPITSMSAS